MKKWERRAYLAVAEAGAKVIERQPASGHLRLIVELPSGVRHRMVLSCSPSNEDHAALAVKRRVLALINPPTA